MSKGIKEEFKELYTYCAKEKGKSKNIVTKIKSIEIKHWKGEYINCFSESYFSSSSAKSAVRLMYRDPDTTYKKGFDHHFFEQLVEFLRKRECQLKDKLEGKYEYAFDKALNQVADWIIGSRTLGGSFLWPVSFYEAYNMRRGGTIKSNRSHYIQDRVDLTLWEIYYWYHEKKKLTIMTRIKNKQAKEDLKKWLSHFKDFQTYIEFFCLEAFVSKEKSIKSANLRPINILSSKVEEPKWGEKGENPKIEISLDLEFNTIADMLKGLNKKILIRSEKMEQIISSECNENSKTK